jgi:dipeptidyl aminopeptidase/acylaminoacyl peptidase
MHRPMPRRSGAPTSGHAPFAARTLLLACSLLPALSAAPAVAQENGHATTRSTNGKKVLGVDDYTRWRAIEDPSISGDGRWVAYVLRHTNVLPADAKPVLHLRGLDSDEEIEVAGASSPVFSPDSRWVVYTMDSVPTRRRATGRPADTLDVASRDSAGARAGEPARLVLRELGTGTIREWQNMSSGTFSATSTHLLLRRRPPQGGRGGRGAGGGGGGGAGEAGAARARGTDVVVHDLAAGRSQFLGSVGDASFNRQGDALAYTIDSEVKDGNGLFVLDLPTGRLRAVDNDARTYGRLVWRDDGSGLAVLKGLEVEKKRERSNVLLIVDDVRANDADARAATSVFQPDSVAAFPKGFVVSERAPLEWSEDGRRIFFGIIPQTAAPDTARRPSTDSVANVDVWRTSDVHIQSVQMRRVETERNFTFVQAFDVARKAFVAIADSTMSEVQLSPDGRWAVGRDARAYISDHGAAAADIYRVDTSTGERTLLLERQLTGQHLPGIAPDGRHFLYWNDDRFHVIDLDAATSRPLGGADAPAFVNTNWDRPGPKPPFGVEGYTADGKGVVVAHELDLWLLPLDGTSPPRSLTNGSGARDGIRFRWVATEPIDSAAPRRVRTGELIDLARPVTLSAFGERTKKAGFYRLAGGKLEPVVYEDASFDTPVRARHADRFLFTRQTFVEFPDLRVSGPAFADAQRISDANPQQAEYAWGRRIVFDFENRDGTKLQGLLTLPDDYEPGERRPMIVSFYEKNSHNLHRYSPPSFLTGMGSSPIEAVSRGYITMIPDIHFRTGSSHSDMLECVEAAVRKVIELGYADPAHVGLNGHSYGGEGAAFIAGRSRLFAAIGMGAGVTDLYSDFNQSWGWSYQVTGGSGANGSDYYLYGQGRWGFSPWDKPDVYRFESALTHAPDVTAPVLIMHGTADPTVSFSEGMNFYNALRYNGKQAVMLAYPDEGHGLRGLANRRDLTVRYFEFFDHYLRGAPAPTWLADGVPYLRKASARGRL